MELPMNVPVICAGQPCGHAVCVVINPVNKEITHFVARDNKYPHTERLVPLSDVGKTSHDEITLNCTNVQWQQLQPFEEDEDRLHLSIDKAAVGHLPTVAVHRHVTAIENGLAQL